MRSNEAGSVSTRIERAVNLPKGGMNGKEEREKVKQINGTPEELSSKLTGNPVICCMNGVLPGKRRMARGVEW